MSWRDPPSTGPLKTALELENERLRDREERERKQREQLAREQQQWQRERSEGSAALLGDRAYFSPAEAEMQRMRAEREQHEQELARLRQHTLHAMAEDRARHTAEEKELEALIARNSAELRQMQLDEQRRLSEEQARRQWQQQQLTASVLQEQVSNPLGLFYTADAVQDAADVFPEIRRASSGFAGSACVVPSAPPLEALGSNPSASSSASSASAKQKEAEAAGSSAAAGVSTLEAPPPYSERAPSSTSAAPPAYGAPATITVAGTEMPRAAADATARVLQEMDNHAPPPVYAESDLFALQPSLRVTGAFVPTQAQAAPGDRLPRCASCFDQIAPEPDRGFNGQAMRSGASLYHLECYLKKAAPSCAHCTETLIAHPEKGLSGHYGIYKGQKYHVECYQYHVGPRCALCYDVIFASPTNGKSGEWRRLEDGKLTHEECWRDRVEWLRQQGLASNTVTRS